MKPERSPRAKAFEPRLSVNDLDCGSGQYLSASGEREGAIIGVGCEGADVLEVGEVRQPLLRHGLKETSPHQPAHPGGRITEIWKWRSCT